MKTQAELLFHEYKKMRKVDLTLDQFTYILNLYPSLIVCMADGTLDPAEWEGVARLAKGLVIEYGEGLDSDGKEKLEQSFRMEFRYLLDNIDKWQKKFLNALKNHIQDSKSDKELIMESMYLFANSSDNGIGSEEQKVIDMLTERLALQH